MWRRQIAQEGFRFSECNRRHLSLDDLAKLIGWAAVDQRLAGMSSAAKGEPACPPLALFKALMLAAWSDLSDMKLADALDDREPFCRFRGFSRLDHTTERTTFV